MMSGDRRTTVLRGGAPWGFRLAGGGLSPIYITKVRHRSKAALAGLASGDRIISINGISSFDRSLRELNDVIDDSRDQLLIEVQTARNRRLSQSSFDSRENTPIRSINTRTMDFSSYNSSRSNGNFSNYRNSSSGSNHFNSYGRSNVNPLPSVYRTNTAAVQPSIYSTSSNRIYDTPRTYSTSHSNSGYVSDCPDSRRTNQMKNYYQPSIQPANRITVANDANYFSDSECVSSAGPRYYKISRQTNQPRRPSNVVLPIRSMTSKAYDTIVEPQSPKISPPTPRFVMPTPIVFPSQEERRRSDSTIDPELGADLLKSPITNKKRYADSSFFQTPFNTYPTIEEQKKMAKKIASILEGGDPTQKGASKFEKQRQRAEKYTIEGEAPIPATTKVTSYRPFRPLQVSDLPKINTNQTGLPEAIAHSIQEAQHANPLRFVGAPDEFKQMHMQEHVNHTSVPPQAAMNLVYELNNTRGKGAAIFQKRKARSERWVIDENNVKKSNYHPAPSYIGPTTKPWGQHAPASWSADEEPYAGPNYSPVRPKFNLPTAPAPEPIVSPPLITPPAPTVTKFNDFNARPRAFGAWNNETNNRVNSDSIRTLNFGVTSPNASQTNESFSYPSESMVNKWKKQEYSPWSQEYQQETNQSQIPMTHEGVDLIRQRLMQQNSNQIDQQRQNKTTLANRNNFSSHGSAQQHFTDL